MISDKSFKLRLLFAVGDVVHLVMSLLIAHRLTFFNIDLTDNYIFLNIIFILSWLVSAHFFKLFNYERGARIDEILLDLLKAIIVHLLIISTFLSLLSSNHFSKECVLYSFFISYTLLFIWRSFSLFLLKKYRKLGYNYKQVVLIGKVDKIPSIIQFFTKKEHGYKLIAFFSDSGQKNRLKVPSYPISHLEDFCFENKVEEMYYSESIYNSELLDKIIRFCDDSMIRLKIIPDFSAFKQRKFVVDFYSSGPIITLREEPLQDEFNRILKRFFDIIFSLIVVGLILSWLVPLIATLIKLTSKGPVFFVQRRSGLDNKEFNCLKFRTMAVNDDSDSRQASKTDSRITPLGRFLRKTSLDEMPQFFNVLLGDMSVVGPRPHMLKHTSMYSNIIEGYMVRQLVLPGITGAAQANGYRGETKVLFDMEQRVKYDVWYIENWSLFLDLKLIVLTIINMIKGQKNAY